MKGIFNFLFFKPQNTMSYHIVKSISVLDGKVYITGSDNNVSPRTPYKWECVSLTKILQEKGKGVLNLEIFKDYENGNFQGRSNKYTKALQILKNDPEYQKFDWRNCKNLDNDGARKSLAFDELLKKALDAKLPKDKFVLTKETREGKCYLKKGFRGNVAKWTWGKNCAKTFAFANEAEKIKTWYEGGNLWNVEFYKLS